MRKITLIITFLFATTLLVVAQAPQKLPFHEKIRTAKLDNGLTYFVMQNSEPKGLAEFYIAQKVGSILEEENQRGLAHFLEHMAFNGTKNFPGKGLITYLEKIGVKFGANLNAYTAIDETVYNISAVPVKREGIIDSCLLILHDWSHELLLTEEEIDSERGVIREELRTRNNAQQRMTEEILPIILPDNKYAHRLPGGLVEVVDNFKYQELRDYYHKWYRPDLQGIIVIGDFDVDVVEQKIINLFSKIEMPANAAARTIYPVEPNQEPLIGIAADPEAQGIGLSIMYKKEQLPYELRSTTASSVMGYMNNMVINMLNSRLAELAQKPNPPFLGARAGYGNFIVANTMNSFDVNIGIKEGEIENSLTAITTEIEKIRRYGFTPSEYERAKANYTSSYESTYREKDKLSNGYYVKGSLNYFLNGYAFPGIEISYMLMQQLTAGISLEQINKYAASLPTEENMVMTLMMPKKDGLEVPAKETLLAVYNKAREADVEPYKEELSDEPLIPALPPAGKVVSVEKEPIGESTVWNLSNGAKVVLMKTDFKDDQILFTASSKGGYSLFDKKDVISSKIINDVYSLGGLGNFSILNLGKVLAGKNASFAFKIGGLSESVNGNCSPKDIETLMQLIHLGFTNVRKDKDAFESWRMKLENQLKNAEAHPGTIFNDSLQSTLYGRNLYMQPFKKEMVEQIDYDRVMELGKERFANAADFTFIFVGNIDEEALKPLVETYIASLPSNKAVKEEWKDMGYRVVKGKVTNEFEQEMQKPKTTVFSLTSGNIPYTLENSLLSTIASQVFDLVFTRTIREEEQGTYGVSVKLNLSYYPEDSYSFSFNFDTDVALKERLLKRAYQEIDNVVKNGIDTEDFNKILEYMNKNYEQNLRNNSYWLSSLNTRFILGKDYHHPFKAALDSVTPGKVHNFIKEIFSTDNRIEVIMNGFIPSN